MRKRLDDSCERPKYFGPWRGSSSHPYRFVVEADGRKIIEVHSRSAIRVDISIEDIDKLREDEWAYDSSKSNRR